MSGLTRKRVKVRGKNGKTFQRSVMVRGAQPNHMKTAAWSGLVRGLSSGVGHYAGAHAGHAIGSRVASKQYARDKDSGKYHRTANMGSAVGGLGGMVAGGLGSHAVLKHKSSGYRAFLKEARSNPHKVIGALAVHQAANLVGWGAGLVGSATAHAVYNRRRK